MLAAATTPNSKASKDVSLDTGFGFGCGQRIGGGERERGKEPREAGIVPLPT